VTTDYANAFSTSPGKLSDADLADQIELMTKALIRSLSPTRLDAFTEYVFELKPADHQMLWIDALEAVDRGEITKLLAIAPPGHAKSTYHSLVFPAWYLGRHPNSSILAVTTAGDLAETYGDTVRTVIEQNPRFRKVFPDVAPWYDRGWSKTGFFVHGRHRRKPGDKDPSGVFVGAGGPVIGRRADGVIVDDAVDEATARSETLLAQRRTWLGRSVMSRLKPGGWRIVVGTLWAEGDVVDEAMQSGEYVVIHMRAQSDGGKVEADVWVPDGVSWRPTVLPYREVDQTTPREWQE
jgi:hypothetical protein